MLSRKPVVAAILCALVGCGLGESADEGSSDIINGSVDGMHDSVVLLAILDGDQKPKATCTATVVAPNMVLTARHCVSETDESSLCRTDGTAEAGAAIKSDVEPNNLVALTGRVLDGLAVGGRGKQVLTESTTVLCDRDVAFIVLDRALDVPVAPIRLKGGARRGEALTAVGWGRTETGEMADQRMMRPGVVVQEVGPLAFSEAGGAGLGGSEFLVGEAFCAGDSGGPSFSAKGAIVGVVSRGGNGRKDPANRAAGCIGDDTVGYYTHLGEKAELVTRAFAAAGFTPYDEDDASDGGANDGGDADARSTPSTTADGGPTDPAVADSGTTGARPDASSQPDPDPPPPVVTPPTPSPPPPDTTPPPVVVPPPPPAPVTRPNGASCVKNADCSSAACIEGTCVAQCPSAGSCPSGQVCTTKSGLSVCTIKLPTAPTSPSGPGAGSPLDPGVADSFPPMPAPVSPGSEGAPSSGSTSDPSSETDAGKARSKASIGNQGCSAAGVGSAGGSPWSGLPSLGIVGAALLVSRRRRASRGR